MPRSARAESSRDTRGGSSATRRAARAVALSALKRCQAAFSADAPPLTADDRARLLELLTRAQRAFEAADAPTQRPATRAVLRRMATLERQLASMAPGERAAAIRARLGLSRSRYYELRGLLASPENIPGLEPAEVQLLD